jgi:hypothetical protein
MAIGWKILQKIIPYGRAEEVADEMGNVTLDTVHRWMRAPLSTENPHATGRANPIDRAVRLIKAVHKVNPEETHEIVDAFVSLLAQLDGESNGPAMSDSEIEAILRARARDLIQAANALAAKRKKGK